MPPLLNIPIAAHGCQTCQHFDVLPERVGIDHNRNCCYKGAIYIKEGRCGCWKDARTLKMKLLRKHPVKALVKC